MTFDLEGADPVTKCVSVVGGLLVQDEDTYHEKAGTPFHLLEAQ